jgi:hypothetical protein
MEFWLPDPRRKKTLRSDMIRKGGSLMAFQSFEFDPGYLKGLVAAGFDGIVSARHEITDRVYTPPSPTVLLTPTAMGAAVGALSARLLGKRKSGATLALGGLVGSIVGCGAALAWASRGLVRPAARRAARQVNAVRDAHWLQTNPIDYA